MPRPGRCPEPYTQVEKKAKRNLGIARCMTDILKTSQQRLCYCSHQKENFGCAKKQITFLLKRRLASAEDGGQRTPQEQILYAEETRDSAFLNPPAQAERGGRVTKQEMEMKLQVLLFLQCGISLQHASCM